METVLGTEETAGNITQKKKFLSQELAALQGDLFRVFFVFVSVFF